MPKSNKERLRTFMAKIKADPVKHEEYLKKERERYQKRKETGKLKSIKDMTQRGQRQQRRQWKINQKNSRKKRKDIRDFLQLNSPPTSPEVPDYGARERGRKKVRRDRAQAYRTIHQLKTSLKQKQTNYEKYRKKYYRLQKNTRTLVQGMRAGRKDGKAVRKVFDYGALRRHRILRFASRMTGIGYRTVCTKKKRIETQAQIYIHNVKQKVYEFLNRDDNSRLKAGKKDTVTKRKVKKQKRILNDNMKNLHIKFLSEYHLKISYSLFCKLRPFWIKSPTSADHDTCLCRTHENLQYKAEKLFSLGVLKTSDLNSLVKDITCDIECKECMYQECNKCILKQLEKNTYNPGQQTSWYMWVNRREERESVSGEILTVQVTRKVEENGTIEHLLEVFEADLRKSCRHFYNISHQFKSIRQLRDGLADNEVVIHIDFSENYNCKYEKEIQSVHFGASHEQATLHTGMAYFAQTKFSFCSISECNRHDPAAIWAHIAPLLEDIRSNDPNIDTLHIISDGPTTQYRNKSNFYLFSTRIYTMGFKVGSWNFLEAGHGKGAADGVGAAVKRTADDIVKRGIDIPNGHVLYEQLKSSDTSITLYFIKPEDVKKEASLIPENLCPIKGTMLLHQLYTVNYGEVLCRVLSCFCKKPVLCDCYGSNKVQLSFLSDNINSSNNNQDQHEQDKGLKQIHELTEDLKGQWGVVEYDKQPYPGIIQDVRAGEVEVKVMHRIGNNRFFWPSPLEDILWYEQEHFMGLIPPPTLVTKRHHQMEKQAWTYILKILDEKY